MYRTLSIMNIMREFRKNKLIVILHKVPLMFENDGENNSNEDINKHGTDNEGTSDCYESVRDSPLTYHPFLENLQPVTLAHQLK